MSPIPILTSLFTKFLAPVYTWNPENPHSYVFFTITFIVLKYSSNSLHSNHCVYSRVTFPQTMNFNSFRGSLFGFEYNYMLWVQIVVFATQGTNGNDLPAPVVYRLYASELGLYI